MSAVFLLCVLAGVAIYFVGVRPWLVPLTQRIPHDRKYWPGMSHNKKVPR